MTNQTWHIYRDGEHEAGPFDSQLIAVEGLHRLQDERLKDQSAELAVGEWSIEPGCPHCGGPNDHDPADHSTVGAEPETDYPRHLVVGLVGPHRTLYQTSPTFRQAIDTLVALLPAWTEGLAVNAADMDERLAAMMEAAKQ